MASPIKKPNDNQLKKAAQNSVENYSYIQTGKIIYFKICLLKI